jgi:Flp pilus assembly pilin Flp
MIARSLRRLWKSEEGAGMVEFALVVVLLFTLIFAVIDFGRLLFLYNSVGSAAREGARFASVQFGGYGPCVNTYVEPDNTIITTDSAVKRYTRAKILEFAAKTANPTVTLTCPGGAPSVASVMPSKLIVTVTGIPFKPVTPLPFVKNMTVTRSATVRFEGAADMTAP